MDAVVDLDEISISEDESHEKKPEAKTTLEKKSFIKLLMEFFLKIARSFASIFMVYFAITILFWGSGDFLLSYLASQSESLSGGDTLAFLSVGNLIGTCISKIILWRWKKSSWSNFISSDEDLVLPISKVPSIHEDGQNTSTSTFTRIRSLVKKPEFLNDAFKLSFISGVIGSVAPLGYYMLSVGGGEASTIAPLISLYVIVPTILGLFVLKEKKNLFKFAGIICAVAAVFLFAIGGGAKHWSLLSFRNIVFFCLGFFGWGISYFIRGIAAKKAVDFGHLILMATCGLMFGNYLLVIFVFGIHPFEFTKSHALTVVAGSCQVLGDLGFFLLSKEGKESSKVVPLTGTYILVPSILGFVFLKDTVTIPKILGIILSISALGLLGAS